MTFKELVVRVAKREGKKQEVNIAQISEVTKIVLEELADEFYNNPWELVRFLKKYW